MARFRVPLVREDEEEEAEPMQNELLLTTLPNFTKMTKPDLPMTIQKNTMRAATLVQPRQFEIHDVPIPMPETNAVRVCVEGCGVCASNIPPYEGRDWFTYPFPPGRLGHEAWGFVDAVGEDVRDLKVGERVAFLGNQGYAEYDVVEADAAIRLPHELDGRAFPGEPLGCAVNIFRRAQIVPGQMIAIVGIGFLGALLISMAASAGATVIAIARRPFAQSIAREMGAEHVVAMDDHWHIIEEVRRLTDGALCSCVIECVGKQWPLDLAGALCAVRGRLVVAGYHQDGVRQVNMQAWNWNGLDVINAHERDKEVYRDGVAAAAALVAAGALNADKLYTHVLPLEQIGHALDLTIERPEGFLKALVRP